MKDDQQTSKDFEIAIIGAGITGLTLAIALYYRGVNFTIYEAAPKFGEIGAGVSFTPNALEAMKICHKGIYDSFEEVCTRNMYDSKQKVWFDYHDGRADIHGPSKFTISNSLGQNGVHRARFLDSMQKLVPQDVAKFNKRLKDIDQPKENGKLKLNFEDGTSATADLIIGCDGIKSRVRRAVVGAEHPSVHPSYTHKYAYRGLIPMEKAIKAIGEEQAQNACMHCGKGAHVLTFPVNHGKTLNVVAFKTTSEDWPDSNRLTKNASQAQLLEDFADFGSPVKNLLKLTEHSLDVWAIFDLGINPVPSFYSGRICIAGDAAHATSPHHGAGAGFCVEDSAMLAELLADPHVKSVEQLEDVLKVFDTHRRERGQWLVQSSRFIGDTYEMRADGVGDDWTKMEAQINQRNDQIAKVDLAGMIAEAKKELVTILSS